MFTSTSVSPPPSADGPRLPWVERDRLGFVNAFVETAKLIVQQPAEAFARIRADGDYVSPLLFGGLVMLVVVLEAVGIPAAGIALIMAPERILDMIRTMVNITGDASVAVVVASTEGELDAEFSRKHAGE